jgi:hypothetical protein
MPCFAVLDAQTLQRILQHLRIGPFGSLPLIAMGHGQSGSKLSKPDEMRRPVSGRDAVRSQVIDVLEAQIKGDRQ